MNLRSFLGHVLPLDGRFCLFHKAEGYPKHEWFESLDELARACEHHNDTTDLYFGTASYLQATERTQGNVKALRSMRIDIDAGEKKFAKDPEGTYPDQKSAVIALNDAVKAGLPKPNIVLSSGEGIHAYWELHNSVEPTFWVPVAKALQRVCAALGLKVDNKVTSDTARILRPVGSLHNNGKRVGAVLCKHLVEEPYNLTELNATLTELLPEEDLFALATESSKLKRNYNDDILEIKGPPAHIVKVADHCASIAWVRDTQGVVPEPVWRSFMGVAKYCEDGEQFVHEWSQGDPRYDFHETQAKFERWETPPATCDSFAMYGKCKDCKYKGKITTPKQLGYIEIKLELEKAPEVAATWTLADIEDTAEPVEQVEEVVLDDGCPVPGRQDLFDPTEDFYYHMRHGEWTLFKRETKKDIDETGTKVEIEYVVPVVNKLIWVDSCANAGTTDGGEGQLTMLCRMDNTRTGDWTTLPMPSEYSATPDSLAKFMHSHGIFPSYKNPKAALHLKHFLVKEQDKKSKNMNFVLKNRFGYHWHDKRMVCSLGAYTVHARGTARGEVQHTMMHSSLRPVAHALTTTCLPPSKDGFWGPEVWKEHVFPAAAKYISFLRKHYNYDGYDVARLAIAVPLASPMIVFCADAPFTSDPELPATGLVVSLFSQGSGKGKSAIQEAIAVAYGKPSLKRAGKRAAMTDIASLGLAYTTAVYPFILDEVTRNSGQEAAAMIDSFANGTARVRSSTTGQVNGAAQNYALITCMSTNVPQRELIASAQKSSSALSNRLLELDFDQLEPTGNHSEFIEDFKKLSESCGSFGLMLAYLTVNRGLDAMNDLAQEKMREAYEYLGVSQEFRFFVRGLASVLMMHDLLGKHYPFDIEGIKRTYKKTVSSAVWSNGEREADAQTEVDRMMSDLSPSIAVTKTWRNTSGADILLNPHVRQPLAGREVQDGNYVLVDSGRMREWCMENQISVKGFLDRANAAGLVNFGPDNPKHKPVRTRLTTGLRDLPSVMAYCYAFKTRTTQSQE